MTLPSQTSAAASSSSSVFVRKARWTQLEIPATRFSCITSGSLRPKLGLCILTVVLVVAVCLILVPLVADAPKMASSAALQSPEKAKAVSNANTAFMAKIYPEMVKGAGADANIVSSPFSLSSVMAMLRVGAAGETASQITDALAFPADEDALAGGYEDVLNVMKSNENFTLDAANRLYSQTGFDLLESYLAKTSKHFQAEAQSVNFADEATARQAINSWVEEKTNSKIKDLIPEGVLSELTRLVLVNAVYFKGSWAQKFNEKHTSQRNFTTSTGEKKKVDMMFMKATEYSVVKDSKLDALVLAMPYKGDRLNMVFFLSDKPEGFSAMEANFPSFDFAALMAAPKEKFEVHLPKFKIETTHDLNGQLQALGLSDMFSMDKADFSGVGGQPGELFVSKVLQKAFVEVNEEGTEAAAATGAVMMTRAMIMNPTFECNRPFVFAIHDSLTGMVLFAGRVMDPTLQ